MKVFLSWSGELSKEIAEAFKEFLEAVIQQSAPWMSTTGIDSGEVWSEKILSNLSDTKFGVLFLTADKKDSPWVLFEAGALMKQFDKAKVCPLLIDLEPTDLKQPLALFQGSTLTEDGVLKIIESINKELDNPLANSVLRTIFDALWPSFKTKCDKAIEKSKAQSPPPPQRTNEDILKEILITVRGIRREQMEQKPMEQRTGEVLSAGSGSSKLVINKDAKLKAQKAIEKLKSMKQEQSEYSNYIQDIPKVNILQRTNRE